jgi:hypothetical protein
MELPTVEQYCDQLLETCANLLSLAVKDEQQDTLLKETVTKTNALIDKLHVQEIQKKQLTEKLARAHSKTQVVSSQYN